MRLTSDYIKRAAKILTYIGLFWSISAPWAIAQVTVPGATSLSVLPAPTPSAPTPEPEVAPPTLTLLPQLQNTFPDRVSTCLQRGSASGLTLGSLDQFTAQCVNSN
jgi:hypothetical protein